MTCEQGDQHRWDARRSRCLDCGREAASIADEVWEWLGEKEDWIDHTGDQIEALRALYGVGGPTLAEVLVSVPTPHA